MNIMPSEILSAFGWCMIISCIGWWMRNIISFLIDDEKESIVTKVVKLFSRWEK